MSQFCVSEKLLVDNGKTPSGKTAFPYTSYYDGKAKISVKLNGVELRDALPGFTPNSKGEDKCQQVLDGELVVEQM